MKILVPTDFSTTANNALEYAIGFAIEQKGTLVLYHCYYPKINPANVLSTPGMDQYMEQVHLKMEKTVASHQSKEVAIESVIEVGFIVDKIVEDAEEREIDLIIMGNTGQGHGVAPLIGSVSSETALRAHCPVLLIPAQQKFTPPKEIALASNPHSLQERFLARVTIIAELLNAQLDLVHIDQRPEDNNEEETRALLPTQLKNSRISYLSLEQESIIDGLNQYAEQNDTDWLVMVPREKSFWQKLFVRSNTKEMAGKSRFPLLVIHNRDTKTEIA